MKKDTITLRNGVEVLNNIVYRAITSNVNSQFRQRGNLEIKRGEVTICRVSTKKRSVVY